MPVPQRISHLLALLGSASIAIGGTTQAAELPLSPPSEGAEEASPSLGSVPSLIEATPAQTPPIELELSANSQGFDLLANRFVAFGNVQVILAGGRLLADRIEYETSTQTIYASGRIRFQRGSQYFQASKLRYSLIENSGDIDDVYGIIDLDSSALDLNPSQPPSAPLLPLSYWESPPKRFLGEITFSSAPLAGGAGDLEASLENNPLTKGIKQPTIPEGNPELLPANDWRMPPVALSPMAQTMACPPPLPAIPDWHPYPWAATAWGGQMIDANFGDTFLFKGRFRPEYLWGVGLNKRLLRAGPLALEFDSTALIHNAAEQPGGEFNQNVPFADTPAQTFGEFTWSFGVRAWLRPWLSLAFFEGVSLNTNASNYEKTFRENFTTFLNYLGFEVEAIIKPEWSIVGRIHHRSGAYGTYSGVSEGSNAYLVGMRYRFGSSPLKRFGVAMDPPDGCPGGGQPQPKPLSEQLNQVALGSAQQATGTPTPSATESRPSLTPTAQEAQRREAINAVVDQRVEDLQYQRSLTAERRTGVDADEFTTTAGEVTYGQFRPWQLRPLTLEENRPLVRGMISRWRMQANQITVTPDGWRADRVALTNDPYTPAQSWVDATDVVAKLEVSGDVVIEAKRNQLILENRLPIPLQRNQRFEKKRDVESRWVTAFDSEDRDGFYLGYNLKPIKLGANGRLNLQPQFMAERALNGSTNSYVLPGQPIGDPPSSQPTRIGDLFGLLARYEGRLGDLNIDANGDFSTFDPSNFANGARSWGNINKSFDLPLLGTTTARAFGAYRFRVWNGSLGEQDVYSALGTSLEQERDLPNLGQIKNQIFWRAGIGNFQGTEFTNIDLSDLWRASFYGSINSQLQVWTGKALNPGGVSATRFSPAPIIPGLALNTNLNANLAYYGDGSSQQAFSISGGPTLTFGHLQKDFFDYTQLTVTGGGTLLQGGSPFSFDRIVDLSTIGIGLTQQLAGPLMFVGGIGLNVDPSSEFYGDVVDSYVELRWQRRAYELAIYYSPFQGIGGIRVKLNDFNFRGTGLPFVPYAPPSISADAAIRRRGF